MCAVVNRVRIKRLIVVASSSLENDPPPANERAGEGVPHLSPFAREAAPMKRQEAAHLSWRPAAAALRYLEARQMTRFWRRTLRVNASSSGW